MEQLPQPNIWYPQASNRTLFSDGWNSAIHFTLGMAAAHYMPILYLFGLYELLPIHKDPIYAIGEFGMGYLGARATLSTS
jgi:hypothetical protein